jgi:hypothetical protein
MYHTALRVRTGLVQLVSPFAPAEALARLVILEAEGNLDPPVRLPRRRAYGTVRVEVIDHTFRLRARGVFKYNYQYEWRGVIASASFPSQGSLVTARAGPGPLSRVCYWVLGAWMTYLSVVGLRHGAPVIRLALFMAFVAGIFALFASAMRQLANPERDALFEILVRALDGRKV